MKDKTFITTAIDYANNVIHIGHAYEKILADSYARYHRTIKGEKKVLYTTGTDEHGSTNQRAAEARNLDPKEHADDISKKDRQQIDSLNVSYDRFIRTTDKDHIKNATKFFKKVYDNGDIYKGKYEGFYCEGCEAHKTLSELDKKGKCKNHSSLEIQKLSEENYFFKWSKYEGFLKELIETNKLLIEPEGKRKEMLAFLESGLNDLTISRPKYKVSWGITTPIDEEQVIYVWFDALINYLTEGLNQGFWEKDTNIIHFVGKDIARWHTLLWPAMLKSADYRTPDIVHVHGFLNLEGEKISKSLGNVIRPKDLVDEFGVDPIRYYFLKHGPINEDSDLSIEHFKEVYNGELANGLGNTVARIAKLAQKSEIKFPTPKNKSLNLQDSEIFAPMNDYRPDKVLRNIWEVLGDLDKHINENEPWAIEDKKELEKVLSEEIDVIRKVSQYIKPFMPDTAEKIQKQFGSEEIKADKPLFPRL